MNPGSFRGGVAVRPRRVHRDAAAAGVGDVEVARSIQRDAHGEIEAGVATHDRILCRAINNRATDCRRGRCERNLASMQHRFQPVLTIALEHDGRTGIEIKVEVFGFS